MTISFTLGSLEAQPAADLPELLAPVVLAALTETGTLADVGVVAIDADVSDTAASQEAFDLQADSLANCVIVAGKRDGEERIAAVVVLSDSRADVNGAVKRRLDVRKASFLAREDAVERSGMEYGGISPIGLPADWPVLVDSRVASAPLVVIGSGIRASKILVPGAVLASLPGTEVIEGLGKILE